MHSLLRLTLMEGVSKGAGQFSSARYSMYSQDDASLHWVSEMFGQSSIEISSILWI